MINSAKNYAHVEFEIYINKYTVLVISFLWALFKVILNYFGFVKKLKTYDRSFDSSCMWWLIIYWTTSIKYDYIEYYDQKIKNKGYYILNI